MSVVEVLKRVRARLDDPKHWTQGAFARNKEGHATVARDPMACSWCLLGAIEAETQYPERNEIAWMLRIRTSREGYGPDLSVFNDSELTNHTAVLELLDKAIHEYAE